MQCFRIQPFSPLGYLWSVASASRRPSFGRLFHWSTTSSVHLLPSSAAPLRMLRRDDPPIKNIPIMVPNLWFLRPLNMVTMVSGGMFSMNEGWDFPSFQDQVGAVPDGHHRNFTQCHNSLALPQTQCRWCWVA